MALIFTGVVLAGCGGRETRQLPAGDAKHSAEAIAAPVAEEPSIATVTFAPGAAHPQIEAACGARCKIMESPYACEKFSPAELPAETLVVGGVLVTGCIASHSESWAR